jgi:hypothetical protein
VIGFEHTAAPNGGSALNNPGTTYWMVACSVYLFIATLGLNVRICR